VLRILRMGDVEVHRAARPFRADGRAFEAGDYVIPMHQPYAAFAQTLLEVQEYPDLRVYPGGPPRAPYDVTAHTLPLLMDVEARSVEQVEGGVEGVLGDIIDPPAFDFELPPALRGEDAPRVALYKSWQEPMEAGWTRWVFDQYRLAYDTLHNADIRAGGLGERFDVILLQDQSARSIAEGYPASVVPAPYAGGLGEEGARALEAFVREGGRIVAIESATDYVIDLFGLDVANAVERLPEQDFYVPGSILQIELDGTHPIARGLGGTSPAWYWRSSRAFDVGEPAARVIARYGAENPLLSGWILGPEYLSEKPALVEVPVGEGSVVLFGFQPNYRAQTVATWPLLFNALSEGR